jgi:hypothetical protein
VKTYSKIRCVCGRRIGGNVIRQHRRMCPVVKANERRRQELQAFVDDRLDGKKKS